MTLSEWLDANENGVDLARKLGITPSMVSNWRTGTKPVAIARCVDIERATGGAVTRRDLRPNDWWRYWPELDRRAPRFVDPEKVTVSDS